MAKPATIARQEAAAKGFTQVIGRGNAHIITKNPSTGKCAYDGQVGGGWHYGAGLETDTALEPDTDTNYWKMVKALYNIKVRKSFQGGDLLRWTDPSTGQYVILQPNNLSWVDNVTASQQFISSPAAVTGVVTDDVALWTNGYGTGRHFRYQAGPLRLTKHLIIDAASNLPTPTVSNPYLEIAFVMTPSSGVSLIADGVAWDKKTKTNTANAIEFRTSGGVTLWSFSVPTAYDSAGNEVAGIMQLRKQGANYIAAIRIPKSFFDTATYPVYIDPTVDYQVGATANDGTWDAYGAFDDYYCRVGCWDYGGSNCKTHMFARWPGVTIPVGATITNAYVSIYRFANTGTPSGALYFNDVAAAVAPTTYATANGKVKTTATITWNPPTTGTWVNSGDCKAIIQELVDSYNYSAGSAMMMLWLGTGSSGDNWGEIYDYKKNNSRSAKLHIEYTEAAAGGKPLYAYAQQ